MNIQRIPFFSGSLLAKCFALCLVALSVTGCGSEAEPQAETRVDAPEAQKTVLDNAESEVPQAEENSEKGYELLAKPQAIPDDGKFYVEEFFLYSCRHCYNLEPALEKWLKSKPKDVTFERVPAILGKQWGAYAHVYYVMEHNGFIEQSHRPMFDAIHKQGKFMNNLPELIPFLGQYGMSKAEVKKAFTEASPAVAEKVKQALLRISAYQLSSVPTFVVNGKYKVSASTAGGEDKIFTVIDRIIQKERLTK